VARGSQVYSFGANETCSSRAVITHIFYTANRGYAFKISQYLSWPIPTAECFATLGRASAPHPSPPLCSPCIVSQSPACRCRRVSDPGVRPPSAPQHAYRPFWCPPAPPTTTPGTRMSLYCHCCVTYTHHTPLSFGGIPLTTAPIGSDTRAVGVLATPPSLVSFC
jgi:hypothetical protein